MAMVVVVFLIISRVGSSILFPMVLPLMKRHHDKESTFIQAS